MTPCDAATTVRAIQPHIERGPDGRRRIVHPDDPGFPAHLYAESARRQRP